MPRHQIYNTVKEITSNFEDIIIIKNWYNYKRNELSWVSPSIVVN